MAEVSLELIQLMLQRVLDNQAQHDLKFLQIEDQLKLQGKLVLSLRHNAVTDAELTALVNDRVSALGGRVDRIERRLDLRDA